MQTINILRESKIKESFRVAQVRGMFELSMEAIRHEWKGNFNADEKPWQIGLIIGPSGSGKTTLARELFPKMRFHEGFEWPQDKALVDGFDAALDAKDICGALNSVGFSSPPSWLKPFRVLSNGQKFRAELARVLLSSGEGCVFDEFTSVVDRDVAKIGSAAVAKMIRKKGKPPFVAVSCHYDVTDWLDPDWIFDVERMAFEWRLRRRFPEIKINMRRAEKSEWRIFREHHYLNHDLAASAQCFIAEWKGRAVGFAAAIHFPHPSCSRIKKEHRVVVLPDFQGVGIGNRISEFVGRLYREQGFRYLSTSSNPAMIHHRAKSMKWKMIRFGKVARQGKTTNKSCSQFARTNSCKRITASFEFIG